MLSTLPLLFANPTRLSAASVRARFALIPESTFVGGEGERECLSKVERREEFIRKKIELVKEREQNYFTLSVNLSLKLLHINSIPWHSLRKKNMKSSVLNGDH